MTAESHRNDDKHSRPHRVPMLQFRLSTLLAAVAICSALFAVMVAIGPLWSIVVLFIAIMIGAHVAGAVIGTRLRDEARLHEPTAEATGPIRTAEEPSGG